MEFEKNNSITFQIDKWFKNTFGPLPFFPTTDILFLSVYLSRTSNQLHLFNRSWANIHFSTRIFYVVRQTHTLTIIYILCLTIYVAEIPCTITLHVSSSSMDVQIRHVVHLRRKIGIDPWRGYSMCTYIHTPTLLYFSWGFLK